MSQWGKEKQFKSGETTIRVLSHVSTRGFERSTDQSIIDRLLLIHITGDTGVALEMLWKLETRFVGKPHSEWLNQVIDMPPREFSQRIVDAGLGEIKDGRLHFF